MDSQTENIDPGELRDVLAELAIKGNERYKANTHDNADRPYRRGVGSGLSKGASMIAEHFDLDMYEAENREVLPDV
jgi:hypothetical protein